MSDEERSERVAYVQALLEYTRDDARQVYIRVTAALAVATLFVTQIPFKNLQALDQGWTWSLYAGLALLVLAAILYFIYVGDTHHARRRIAKYLLHPEAVTSEGPTQANPVDAVLTDVWRPRRWWAFWVPDVLFGIGGIILTAVLYRMIASPILPP
jgi:uncharacterized membrane protein YkvI